jgi:DNA-binding transcriptional ArsR family regulator|tara:strand:- start:234 stop:950 length:717 start_codon:yes stop_codon:yes gene_type:complete
MRSGPDIALLAALIGDPARAHMLVALMGGQALTAGELAREAGVTLQTGSFHLARLEAAGVVVVRKQGRHRYVSLGGPEIATVLEALMAATAARGPQRVRPGPAEPALREARRCYDHLAGEVAVAMLDRLIDQGAIRSSEDSLALTPAGAERLEQFGIDTATLGRGSRPLCRPCLDWSARRPHLAGSLGKAMLDRMLELGWARPDPGSRAIRFTSAGRANLQAWLADSGRQGSVARVAG